MYYLFRPEKELYEITKSTKAELSRIAIVKSANAGLATNCHSPHSSAQQCCFNTLKSSKPEESIATLKSSNPVDDVYMYTFPYSGIPLNVQSSSIGFSASKLSGRRQINIRRNRFIA